MPWQLATNRLLKYHFLAIESSIEPVAMAPKDTQPPPCIGREGGLFQIAIVFLMKPRDESRYFNNLVRAP